MRQHYRLVGIICLVFVLIVSAAVFKRKTEHQALQVNGWPGVPYSTVVGYRHEGNTDDGILDKQGVIQAELLKKLEIREATLNENQIARLLRASFDSPIRRFGAACYYPKHVFVFYDSRRRPVAAIEVCFSCTALNSVPAKNTGSHYDYAELARLSSELGLGISDPETTLDEYREKLRQ